MYSIDSAQKPSLSGRGHAEDLAVIALEGRRIRGPRARTAQVAYDEPAFGSGCEMIRELQEEITIRVE